MDYETWKAAAMAEHVRTKPIFAARPVQGRRMTVPRPGKEGVEIFFFPARRSQAPLLLNMHGGGYTGGDAVLMDSFCALMNEKLDIAVANVNYKKTPEYPFPYAVEEVTDLLAVFTRQAEEFGVNPLRMAVSGESAGGGIAAGAALKAREDGIPLAAQLLIYPCTDSGSDPAVSCPGLSPGMREAYAIMNRGYCQGGDGCHRWASPLLAPQSYLEGLAPAVMITCGIDELLYQGEAYARRLTEAGVPVSLRRWPLALHGFIEVNRPDYFFEDSRKTPEQALYCREGEEFCLAMLDYWLNCTSK